MPGMGELLVILLIVLLIFGAGKLPQIGDSLGRSIRNFKRASGNEDDIEVSRKKDKDAKDKELAAARAKVRELEGAGGGDDDIEDAEVVAARRKKS